MTEPRSATRHLLDYLKDIEQGRQLSAHTVGAYRRDLYALAAFLDDYYKRDDWNWDGVDRLAVRAWLSSMSRRGLARRTIARKVSAARSFFRHMHREDIVEANPVRALRSPRLEKTLPAWLTRADMEAVFSAAQQRSSENTFRGTRDHAIVELFYATGMRLSELASLDMSALDLVSEQARVLGKGRKERIVPIGRPAITALRRYELRRTEVVRKTQEPHRKAVFLSERGRRLTTRQIQNIVRRFLDAAACDADVSTHSLRHSFATHLLDAGADLLAVKELLGHASLSTTRIYTHLAKDKLKKVYDSAHPRA